jgi:type VI secretion system protein ImpH
MATQDRLAAAAVGPFATLAAEPWRFDFHRAMRLLECRFAERPRLGRSRLPGEDGWRLGQQPTTSFAPTSIAAVLPATDARPPLLLVYLFGLLGPNGPMPLHLSEYVLERLQGNYGPSKGQPDPTLARFLDVFHHRLVSLLWRARADAEPSVEADRPAEDRFARRLLALGGFLLMPSEEVASPERAARRFWVGHLSRRCRNVEGLASILRGFFGVGIRIDQFVGRWLPMPGSERCRLGAGASALGGNAFLGDEIWNCTQTIRIVCGPLDRRRYDSMLPGGTSWRRLSALVRDYCGDELAWEVLLVQGRDHVPRARLDARVRLGWTAWLGDAPIERDRADLVLQAGAPYRHRHEEQETDHE